MAIGFMGDPFCFGFILILIFHLCACKLFNRGGVGVDVQSREPDVKKNLDILTACTNASDSINFPYRSFLEAIKDFGQAHAKVTSQQ